MLYIIELACVLLYLHINGILSKIRRMCNCVPAASACFDKVWNEAGCGQLGFDTIVAVADLKRLTIGLSPPS